MSIAPVNGLNQFDDEHILRFLKKYQVRKGLAKADLAKADSNNDGVLNFQA